jgi:agmatine deiminase
MVDVVDDNAVESPMWRGHDIALLKRAQDADGRKLTVVPVFAPRSRYWNSRFETFAPCYLNAYIANGAVVTGCFGDTVRDEAGRAALAEAFPGRKIVMLRIDAIASGGGGVHCLTQPLPACKPRSDRPDGKRSRP